MDRRFFENDNIEDLTNNEGPENFQKIEEEEEVLKENYIWSDEEENFSPNEILDKNDVDGAVISVGGSILVYGQKPDKSPWKIAITDPRGEDDSSVLGGLTINKDCYISTSGDYEKYIMKDGVRHHHILDPSTGYPADSGLISVTIVCDR